MKRLLLIGLLLGLAWSSAWAQRVTLWLDDVSLAEALRQIDHAQHDKRIVFVLNDLEQIRVTCHLQQKEVGEAVNEVCQGHPILITEADDHLFVEYIRPPMHLLPNVTKLQRWVEADEQGYVLRPRIEGMAIGDLLSLLPHLLVRDGQPYLDGLPVQAIYLDGVPLTDLTELEQLQSQMIAEVRTNERERALYLTLRKARQGGFYGSAYAETDLREKGHEEAMGAVWYSRIGKTSLYDKLSWDNSHLTDDVKQTSQNPKNYSLYHNERTTDNYQFCNRLSLLHEFTARRSLGFSYYLATHHGKGMAMKSDWNNFNDFASKNQYADQELTLRYSATMGRQLAKLNVLADLFSRQTHSENVSLYGAGVGTEMGESPSITMWKLAADLHYPITPGFSLLYDLDARYFSSHYDPKMFLSNFQGSTTFPYEMEQEGALARGSLGFVLHATHCQIDAGISPQVNIALQQIHQNAAHRDENPYDYVQADLNAHMRISFPLGSDREHRLTLSYQRELEEIPYAVMSPTVRWSDAYNYSIGNRKLKAPRYNLLMGSASFWQSQLIVTASYQRMQDEIYWQSAVSSGQTDIYYTQPVNLSSTQSLNLLAECNLQPSAHWQLKLHGYWKVRPEDTTLGEVHYDATRWQQYYACINRFELQGGWSMLVNATYQPTYRIYDRTYHSTYMLGGEIGRSWFGNRLRGTLTFTALGKNRRLEREIAGYTMNYAYLSSVQQIGLRLAWNFSGGRKVKVGTVEGGQQFRELIDKR